MKSNDQFVRICEEYGISAVFFEQKQSKIQLL